MPDSRQPGQSKLRRVLMIGCGRMGGALLRRWHEAGDFSFTVVSPSGTRRFPKDVTAVRGAEQLGEARFDLLIIAVKPQQIAAVIPQYMPFLDEHGALVSLAAGFSTASLAEALGNRPVCRVMPNLPVSLGQGVSALYAAPNLNTDQRHAVDELMRPTGTLLWVESEDALDRVTAIAGSGPGYAFEIARCWVDAAMALGLSADVARDIVLGTLQGSVSLALASDDSLDALRDGVTSKNGTTQAGLTALNGDAQLADLFQRTVGAAYARAQALR